MPRSTKEERQKMVACADLLGEPAATELRKILSDFEEVEAERDKLKAERDMFAEHRRALAKINEIRNSIVGSQTINWSEHIYPLVAILESIGIHGAGYPVARKNFGTIIERLKQAEKERDNLRSAATSIRSALRAIVDALNSPRIVHACVIYYRYQADFESLDNPIETAVNLLRKSDAKAIDCPDCKAALCEDSPNPESRQEWYESGHHVCGKGTAL